MKVAGPGTLLLVGTLCAAGCGDSPVGPVVTEHQVVERGAATAARVELDMGAGEIEVKAGTGALLEADFRYNVAALKPVIDYRVDGSVGVLQLSQGKASGTYENHWALTLQEKVPIEFDLDLGAGDADLAIGRLDLAGVEILMGAGDLNVDLRGAPSKSYRVAITGGAGDATIRLPATVGISASAGGLLGDISVTGLEKRDGVWINPRVASPVVTITLNVKGAVGDIKIIAE